MRKAGRIRRAWVMGATLSASLVTAAAGVADNKAVGQDGARSMRTESPIKHVIILIGENRGTDHTFGVYKPKGAGQTMANLLSKGIVREDGSPGPNFALAQQFMVPAQPLYYVGVPAAIKVAYGNAGQMPQPNTNGAPQAQSTTSPPFTPAFLAQAAIFDPSPDFNPNTNTILTTGFTSLPPGSLDTRIPNAGMLPNGPFVLQGPNISDDDYTGDMTHRFYQAWQQSDCSIGNATRANPTGCLNDLFPFVMATYALNDSKVPAVQGNFSQGNEMGFYNAEQEQASLLKTLADRFSLSDNFHQSFMGGTGANHFMLGTGDAAFWSDGNGNPQHSARDRDRQSESAAGLDQQVHGRQRFQQLLRRHTAGRGAHRQLSRDVALSSAAQLRAGALLHARQHQPGFPA